MNTASLRAGARRIRIAVVSLLAAAVLVFGGAGAAHAVATVQPGTVSVPSAQVGVPATVTTDGWGPADVSFAYQWKIGGTDVPGATAATYTPTGADVGRELSVSVTGSADGLADITVDSAKVTVATGSFTQGTPTVTGATSVGSVLTGHPGVIPAGATATYQWYADSSDPIPGATGSTYTPTTADMGRVLHFCVTLSGAGYYEVSYGSALTAPVTAASASAHSATAGDMVTVSGEGFTAGETVHIELHSTPVSLGSVTAAADGSFSTVVRIPAGTAPGAHTLRFFGTVGAPVRNAARAITVTAPPPAAAPAAAPAAPTPRARGAVLADTGAEQSLGVALGGVLLLAAGTLMVTARRTRRA